MRPFTALAAGVALLLAGVVFWASLHTTKEEEPGWLRYREGRQPVVGLADAERLRSQYELWKEVAVHRHHVDLVGTNQLDNPGLASGWVRLDMDSQTIESEVYGMAEVPFDLWFVDNHSAPGASALADVDDAQLRVGTYTFQDGVASLEASAKELVDQRFEIDLMVATPLGVAPNERMLLYGTPSLFQRLHALEQRLEHEAQAQSERLLALGAVAFQTGGVATGFPGVFTDLVTEGEDLFFNETFAGNGRTCGTCHFAANNFTIDTDLIASLPPTDPLFLAEFSKPHIFGSQENLDKNGNPRRFENPALMRAFGLIVENLDGFGDLENRFTMRSVPHNVGMSVSVTRPPGSISFPDGPDERTGWSGDGSPFGLFACDGPVEVEVGGSPGGSSILVRGTTRSFALGAVIQHFPKTMDRDFCKPEPDFRLPTDAELDAFQAFFFGLGRDSELNLASGAPDELILADADAEAGKVLFRDPAASGNTITCNNCHTNAGANAAFAGNTNFNFDTNVEEFLQNRINDPNFTVVGEPRPVDGGFGLNPSGDFTALIPGPGNGNENFGDGTFNTVSVVEAADSAPFFHANTAFTVEESIEFYASPEFAQNFSPILLNPNQVDQVAAFMRAINALDNIEELARPRALKAIDAINISDPNANDVIHFLLEVAIADTQDAMEVLNASGLHNTRRHARQRREAAASGQAPLRPGPEPASAGLGPHREDQRRPDAPGQRRRDHSCEPVGLPVGCHLYDGGGRCVLPRPAGEFRYGGGRERLRRPPTPNGAGARPAPGSTASTAVEPSVKNTSSTRPPPAVVPAPV